MHIELTKSMFRDEFARMGRKDQFSYVALGVLFDYLEDINDSYELDVIELCCDWSELSEDGIKRWYGLTLDEVRDNTVVLHVADDYYLVQSF